jgi:hypothetical protein
MITSSTTPSSTTTLFSESYLRISVHPERHLLYGEWIGYQTVGSVQDGCNRMLALMQEYQAYKVLNCNEQVLGIWAGAAAWVATNWFPRMRSAGMLRFAWVYSPSRFSQISADTTLSLLDSNTHGIKVFYDRIEAMAWLNESEQRETLLAAWVDANKRYGAPAEVIALVVGSNFTPVRAWREHLHISQAQMASRLGVSQIEYAARETVAHLNELHRDQIAAVLGVRSDLLEI